jgi:phage baseplate assembly protein W
MTTPNPLAQIDRPRRTRVFQDLDLNFTPHPVTKDIVRKFDENAIKQSIKNLVLTRNYEKPFHSEIGSPIRALMFDLITPLTALTVKRAIIDVINNYEPRVELMEVEPVVSPDNNSLYVSIVFKIRNTERPVTLDLLLERTR